jgi:hypothetical protein
MKLHRTFLYAIAALIGGSLFGASSSLSQEITINGVARSASQFMALVEFCTEYFFVDIEKATRMQLVYLSAGRDNVGKKQFDAILRQEISRRRQEVQITGRSQWCQYQRSHLEKLGAKDLFVSPQ